MPSFSCPGPPCAATHALARPLLLGPPEPAAISWGRAEDTAVKAEVVARRTRPRPADLLPAVASPPPRRGSTVR
ncbi:MAG: hypothetical protein FWE61_03060 [Micrococcales bacterium]|nr:hypothetical protein [Micrococcales bacterium]